MSAQKLDIVCPLWTPCMQHNSDLTMSLTLPEAASNPLSASCLADFTPSSGPNPPLLQATNILQLSVKQITGVDDIYDIWYIALHCQKPFEFSCYIRFTCLQWLVACLLTCISLQRTRPGRREKREVESLLWDMIGNGTRLQVSCRMFCSSSLEVIFRHP